MFTKKKKNCRVEVSLFVLSPEIEDRGEVEVSNWDIFETLNNPEFVAKRGNNVLFNI
jgi:hypothetical protein